MMHATTQKITAHIPKKLLQEAQIITGKGITETIKAGLEQLAKKKVYERLLRLKGSYQFTINLDELRTDKTKKMIAIDSSSLIAFIQNEKGSDVTLIEETIKTGELVLPPVVLSEILSDPHLPKRIAETILELPILEIYPSFWERAGKTRALLLAKKLKARLADTLIAQSCIDHETILITRDQGFQSIAKHTRLEILLTI